MTDETRPRPQYGEYATPEEQAKAKGLHRLSESATSEPATSAPPVGSAEPHPSAPGPVASGAFGQSDDKFQPAPSAQWSDWHTSTRKPSQADRIITIVLLALGLLNVFGSVSSYLDFPATLQTVYDQVGIGTYTQVDFAKTLGIVAMLSQAVLWLATAIVAGYRLRVGRTAWWVAIVGAAVSVIVIMVIMYIAMTSDPALAEYLDSVR